jgi:hypothetical protein
MMIDNNMGRFFDWLAKPMDQEDITAWHLANNIIPELTELFRDFCLSFLTLIKETYLGDDFEETATKVGMTEKQKKEHLNWCILKTIENFKKENINFILNKDDMDFFEGFFFEICYVQNDQKFKNALDDFFVNLFDRNQKKTKSDIEIFTELYKLLERSMKVY